MSFLGFLHTYSPDDIIDSSDWNDEFNQILSLLGSTVVSNPNSSILLVGQTDAVNDAILRLDNLLTGNILELSNNTIISLIKANGQLVLGASGVVGLIINSSIKCVNLNADLLNSLNASALETKIYSQHSFQVFYDADHLVSGTDSEVFVVNSDGLIVTKLKAKQEGVASADAVTSFEVRKNDVSMGTITISGNTTAVQTNDIADVPLTSGDVISFNLTAYTGTTKHTNVTIAFHYKNKYIT